MGTQDTYQEWFEISIPVGRAKSYKINICQIIKCTCEYFSQKKHLVQTYLMYLLVYSQCARKFKFIAANMFTRAELNHLFTSNINEDQQSARLTLRSLLETTSTPPLPHPPKNIVLLFIPKIM